MPITIYIALAFPVALFILFQLGMPSGKYEMDHGRGTRPGTFFPILIMYHVMFYFIAVAESSECKPQSPVRDCGGRVRFVHRIHDFGI